METISHLLRLGSPFTRTLCIRSCTVPADHFDIRRSCKPGFQCLSLPVRQEIHNAMSLQIDENRDIPPHFPDGPAAYPNHERVRRISSCRTAEDGEHHAPDG